MADAVSTQIGHEPHHPTRFRRRIPIVPVIPRKFERKSSPTNHSRVEHLPPANTSAKSGTSESSTPIDGSLQISGEEPRDAPEKENMEETKKVYEKSQYNARTGPGDVDRPERVLRNSSSPSRKSSSPKSTKRYADNIILERREEPTSPEGRKDSEDQARGGNILWNSRNIFKEENSQKAPLSFGDGERFLTESIDLNNLAREKDEASHPSLSSPFSSNASQPFQSQLQIETFHSHLQYPWKYPKPSYPLYSVRERPSSDYIDTTPTDDIVSPTETDYRGYGHMSYTSVQPEFTPPTDPSPSPTKEPCKVKTPELFHDGQENSPTLDRLSSSSSLYQGYTYAKTGLSRPSPPDNSSSTHEMLSSPFLPVHDQIIPESSKNPSHDGMSPESSIDLSKLQRNGIDMSNDTLRHSSAKIKDSASESKQPCAERPSPTSTLGSFHQQCQSTGPEILAGESFARKALGYQNWRSATLQSLNPTVTETFSNYSPLTSYLLDQFDRELYADILLEVIHERDGLVMAEFKLHSLIMAQNKLFQSLLNASTNERHGRKVLQIRTNERFITSDAIRGALRVLYGEPSHLFIGSCLHIDFSQTNCDMSLIWMDHALAFAASGYFLGLDEVVSRGLHIASSILSWNNIEKAISFALHGGQEASLDPEHALRVDELVSLAKTPTDCISTFIRGASDSWRERAGSRSESRNSPSENACVSRSALLSTCLNYIASEFPISWDFNPSVCPLADVDRLPTIAKHQVPSNKLRLENIQFGDCPPEIPSLSKPRDSLLSSILLSLPFIMLKYVLEQVAEPTKSRIIKPIVAERERRRIQVLGVGEVSWRQNIVDADRIVSLGWQEFVISKQGLSSSLERRWTKFEESHSK